MQQENTPVVSTAAQQESIVNSNQTIPAVKMSSDYFENTPMKNYKSDKLEIGNCENCLEISSRICRECDGFYCSMQCHDKDSILQIANSKQQAYSEHTCDRKLLGNTISPGQLAFHLRQTTKFVEATKRSGCPENGSTVLITGIKSSNELFVRPSNEIDRVGYVKILNAIHAYGTKSNRLEKLPKAKQTVLCTLDSRFYRAQVLCVKNHDTILVQFIDFGFQKIVSLSDLKESCDEIDNLTKFTYLIRMEDVPAFGICKRLFDVIHACIDEFIEFKIFHKETANGWETVLMNRVTNENLNNRIARLQYIQNPKAHDPPVYSQDIPIKLIAAGENVQMVVVNNSLIDQGVVHLIPQDAISLLYEFNETLRQYAENAKGPYTPRTLEMCVVQCGEQNWYRAECLEVSGNGTPIVVLSDFGTICAIHISKIRKYPRRLIKPCFTSPCVIKEFSANLDSKTTDKLKCIFAPSKMVEIESVHVDEENNVNFISVASLLAKD